MAGIEVIKAGFSCRPAVTAVQLWAVVAQW